MSSGYTVIFCRTLKLLLLSLLVGWGHAVEAQSQLFVLVEDDGQLADKTVFINQVSVPVHVLDLGHLDELSDAVAEPLSFVAQMNRTQVEKVADRIKRIGEASSQMHKDALNAAYRNKVVAGEISTRYPITQLPAIIEIDAHGQYRKVFNPPSFESGVVELSGMSFTSAPPPLAQTGSTPKANSLSNAALAPTARMITSGDQVVGDDTQYSVLDAILDGSSPASYDCLDLKISGVCLYLVVRVYCSPLGCSVDVTPEASLEMTHNNPELLVASYKRLGASPLQEARALFGGLQNEISGAAIGVMTGVDVPAEYNDPEKWAAWTSESASKGSAPSALKYHEIDAIGHPGTLYAYIRADGLNPLPDYLASLLEGPNNLVDGIQSSVSQISPMVQHQSNEVDSITASLPNASPVTVGGIGSFIGSMQTPSGADLMEMAQSAFPGSIADAAGQLLGLADTFDTAAQAWGAASAVATGELTDAINVALDPSAISDGLQEQIDKADEIFALIESTSAGFSGAGVGVGGTEVFSMCPGGGEFLKPYLLSGLDMVQWKFNIPEIVFPQTYAPPLPIYDELYVGDLRFNGDDGFQVPNAWGSIYPRNGFVTQPDEMKAAAVAASRAAHVVTRFGQKHVYSPLLRRLVEYLEITYPPPFSPIDSVSGKWQQLVPELDEQCYVFGEDDRVLSPWTRNRQTDDLNHVFALWRQYSCCPTPRENGAVVMNVTNLGTIPLDIDLLN